MGYIVGPYLKKRKKKRKKIQSQVGVVVVARTLTGQVDLLEFKTSLAYVGPFGLHN